MIFELSTAKHSYLEKISKIIHFYWLNTEKHGFLYDRISLEPSNHDFWTQLKMKEKIVISKKTQHFRKYSWKSTFFENIDCCRESQLFSKKWTYIKKVYFWRKSRPFSKNSCFFEKLIFSYVVALSSSP